MSFGVAWSVVADNLQRVVEEGDNITIIDAISAALHRILLATYNSAAWILLLGSAITTSMIPMLMGSKDVRDRHVL
jgi:hypothetical protein